MTTINSHVNDIVNRADNSSTALRLAAMNVRVFPVNPVSKKPYGNDAIANALGVPEAEPGQGGFKLATTDPRDVERMWRAFPESLPAVPMGAMSGIDALDIDVRADRNGWMTINALGVRSTLDGAPCQQTMSGGMHYLFRHDPARPLPSESDVIGQGLDTRGNGGYLICYDPDAFAAAINGAPVAPEWIHEKVGKGRSHDATGKRHPVGTIGMSAPSWELACKALMAIPCADLDYNEWQATIAAFVQSASLHASEADITAAVDMWCSTDKERYEGGKPARDKVADAIKGGTSIGWTELTHKVPPHSPELPFIYFSAPVTYALLTDWGTITNRPRTLIRPLIKGIIPGRGIGMIFGAPKAGKTFIALDMVLSVAVGKPWNGHAVKQNAGPIVYIAGEGHAGFRWRVEAWETERGVKVNPEWFLLTERSVNFGDANALKQLRADIDFLPRKPSCIVIDTVFRATAGANVNEQEVMSKFWAECEDMSRKYECAVLTVHHPSKGNSNASFGSIVSEASVDFQIAVVVEGKERIVRSMLSKDGKPFDDIYFNLKTVTLPGEYEDGDVEYIETCVPEYIVAPEGVSSREMKTMASKMPDTARSKTQHEFMYALSRIYHLMLENGYSHDSWIAREQMHAMLKYNTDGGTGRTPREVSDIITNALKGLLSKKGLIEIREGEDGTPSHFKPTFEAYKRYREDGFLMYANAFIDIGPNIKAMEIFGGEEISANYRYVDT